MPRIPCYCKLQIETKKQRNKKSRLVEGDSFVLYSLNGVWFGLFAQRNPAGKPVAIITAYQAGLIPGEASRAPGSLAYLHACEQEVALGHCSIGAAVAAETCSNAVATVARTNFFVSPSNELMSYRGFWPRYKTCIFVL
jgi:hypothetical protein